MVKVFFERGNPGRLWEALGVLWGGCPMGALGSLAEPQEERGEGEGMSERERERRQAVRWGREGTMEGAREVRNVRGRGP